jgi:electron transfer flavoprotein alpha subunit
MILVIAEAQHGATNRASFEAVAAAQAMGGEVTVVVPGADLSAVAADLAAADVTEVVALQHDALDVYTPDGFTQALASFIGEASPAHVVLPHTYQTRDFAPMHAARMDRALVTDCTGVKKHGAGVAFSRPMFQGKVAADVTLDGPAPHFVTFQIGAYRGDAMKKGGKHLDRRKCCDGW